MKQHLLISLAGILFLAGTHAAHAQTPFNPTVYSGWVSTPGNYFATVPAGSGVTFHQPLRGSGNQFSTASDGINSGQWQNTSATDAITANRFFTFSATANATTAFQIDSLQLVLGRSSTGPDSCMIQYKSPATGYLFVPLTSTTYPILNPTTNPTTLLTIIPASPLQVPASDSIVFRLVAWHASSSLGKMRIINNTAIYGSSLPAVPYTITAPSVQTTGTLCVSPVQGDSIQVTFNSVGTFAAGNTYSLELSDASGAFTTPVTIGSLASQANSGAITGFIPAGTANGAYRLRIKSSNPLVTGSDTTGLLLNPGLVLGASVVQPACPGSSGSIDLTVSGGTGTMHYTWSNGVVSEDLTGLSGGTFDVFVTDGIGCTADSSFQVFPVAAFAVNETVSNVACHFGTDGEISVTVSGGTAPYAISWSGNGINQTGLTASGLPAGQYTLTISDANNCPYTTNYTITQPGALQVSAVITPASCATCNGNIAVITNGGNGPYTYLWSNNSTSGQIIGFPGTYCVTVSDVNSCSADSCFIIPSTAGLNETAAGSFRVVPNPASEAIRIEIPAGVNGPVKLEVTNPTGEILYRSGILDEEQLIIPVRNWPNGIYQLHLITENGEISRGKVVVSH